MREKNKALILLSWIHDFLLFEGIYIIIAAAQNAEKEQLGSFLFQGLLMLVPVALSYIVSCRLRNLWAFLIFSFVLTWGMRTVSGQSLTGGFTAFVCLFRCYVKVREGEIRRKMKELPGEAGIQEDQAVWDVPALLDAPRIFHCLIFVIGYLVLIYLHRSDLLPLMLGILGAELGVCLSYCYLERLERFVKDNIHVANLPAGAMKKIGTGVLLIGLLGLILFMIPAAVCRDEPLTRLRFESAKVSGTEIRYYEENSKSDYLMEELMRLKSQAKETPKWLLAVSELIGMFTLIGIAYLALRMILKMVGRAMEAFADEEDEIVSLVKEDGKGGKERLSKIREKNGFGSPDRKIRRLYKRMMKRALRENPPGNETPLELENRAGLYEGEEERMSRVHDLYEKARYGKETCTKEEAKEYAGLL